MKILIIGGGKEPSKELLKYYVSKCDKIIGVDRGCSYLLKNNIYPDYIVGDFDSINKEDFRKLERKNIKKYQYNCEKDSTDSDIAINLAINMKATEVYMFSMIGSRLDHSFANLGLLSKADKNNIQAYIINDNNKIFITSKKVTIKKELGYKYVSFLAYCDKVEHFNIKNAKYDLEDYTLNIGDNRTVSNEFINDDIEISFKSGKVLIIFSKD